MAAQEVLHALVEIKAQEDLATVAEHHDEGHQRSAGTADRQVTEMCPVDLSLFPGQRLQAQIGFGGAPRSQLRDVGAELAGATVITAHPGHLEQPGSSECRELGQGLDDHRMIGIDDRGSAGPLGLGQARLA